jgi:hypothetical protein
MLEAWKPVHTDPISGCRLAAWIVCAYCRHCVIVYLLQAPLKICFQPTVAHGAYSDGLDFASGIEEEGCRRGANAIIETKLPGGIHQKSAFQPISGGKIADQVFWFLLIDEQDSQVVAKF